MSVVASELIASISAVGADTAEAQMTALSTASDATALSFATVEEASTAASVGESALAANMAELSAMTAEGAAAADAAAASLTTVGDAAATDIPSVEALNAQFAAMQAELASSFAAIDAESAAMAASAVDAGAMAAGIQSIGAALAPVVLIAGALTAILAGVAAHMAGDFQAGITTLSTGAGELDKNLGMVSQGILQMAVDTGTATSDLTAGMYMIESAGFHGAAGLDILKAAAEGAKVGEASLADVANGVTTEMTDYASKGITAAEATNMLIAAVSLGKTHMQDLAQSLATVLPAASAANVGLRDVMAAMATMTAEGTPAAQAATYLRQTILALEAPSKAASKMLAVVGLTTQQVASEMKVSLPGALQMITDAIAKKFPPGSAAYIAALKAIVGGTKQLQGILELTGGHLKTFEANVKGVGDAVKSGGKDIAGWSKVQGDFNTQLARAGEVLQTGLIRLGLQLLPIITPLVKGFADWASNSKAVAATLASVRGALAPMMGVLQQIGAFLVSTFKPVWDQLKVTLVALKPVWDQLVAAIKPAIPALKIIAEIIGVVLIAALILVIKTVALFAQGVLLAFSLIAVGVMAAITGFLRFLAQVSFVVNKVVEFFKWLWRMLIGGSIIPDIVNGIINWFTRLRTMWSAIVSYIVNWVISQFLRLASQLASTMANIVSTVQAKLNQIRSFFLNLIGQAVSWGVNLIMNFLHGLQSAWQSVVSWFTSALNWLKSLWPHSPVKEGPLKGSENWGYNFMRNIADGMRRGFPEVQSAMNALLLLPMNRSFNISGSSLRYPAMSGGSQSIVLQIPSNAFVLEVDGRRFTNDVVGPHLSTLYWTQNGIRQML